MALSMPYAHTWSSSLFAASRSMGCGIVVAPADDIKDPDIVRSLVQQHSVAFLMITPSQFQVRMWCRACLVLQAVGLDKAMPDGSLQVALCDLS